MLYAVVVQHEIYSAPPCYIHLEHCGLNRVNVWIQAPLYFLILTGKIFAYITALEYAHNYLPQTLKVVVQALSLLSRSAGSATVIMHPVHADGPCTRSPPPVQHKFEAVVLHTVTIIMRLFSEVFYRSMRQYYLIQNVQAELRCGRGGWLL